jgi:WD40 repeat protein
VYTGGDQATAWDASSGKLVRSFGNATDQVSAVELAPDGRQLAAATWGGSGGVVHLWNTATSEFIHDLAGPVRVAAMTFTPDGRQLLCRGDDGAITVWEVQKGERVRVLPGAGYRGKPVFSPGGGRLTAIMAGGPAGTGAVGGSGGGRVSFCDAEMGVELCAIRLPATAIGWSPDGSRFLLGNGSVVKIWDSGVPGRGVPGNTGG